MSPERMRAAWYSKQGRAHEVLTVGWQPRPRPGSGEVRVRVHASGINPTDVYARAGSRGGTIGHDIVIPHQDGAGIIDAVGPDVSDARVGQRVWVHMARWGRAFGTAAEWVVCPLDRVVALPDEYPFTLGACLGIPWLTADLAVSNLGAIEDRDVLVFGGAGAVAIYAIQIARSKGARVITTVGDPSAEALVRTAGADAVARHDADDLAARLHDATGGRGLDRVIESRISANAHMYPAILRDRARVVVYGTADRITGIDVSAAIRSQTQLRFVYSYAMTRAARRRAIKRLVDCEAGHPLTHLPVTTYPLEAIADAHADAHADAEVGNGGRRLVIVVAGMA